jgi:hypothetical protein
MTNHIVDSDKLTNGSLLDVSQVAQEIHECYDAYQDDDTAHSNMKCTFDDEDESLQSSFFQKILTWSSGYHSINPARFQLDHAVLACSSIDMER